MGNEVKISTGIVITLFMFCLSNVAGKLIIIPIGFIPRSFITHTVMLVLSASTIVYLRSIGTLTIKHEALRLGKALKSIGVALLFVIGANIILTVLVSAINKTSAKEVHPLLAQMTPLQVIVFIFIYASFAEEMLYRVFLQNYLSHYSEKIITVAKLSVGVPVLISGLLFGLSHFILLFAGSSLLFVVRVALSATVLGIAAGYYQEKNQSIYYAFIVHMAGNLPAIAASFALK